MSTTAQTDQPVEKEKARPGASWKDKEEHVLPKNRLGIVFFGLMCTMFLAALDQVSLKAVVLVDALTPSRQTIVATALPTIVAKLGGGNNYGWVGRYVVHGRVSKSCSTQGSSSAYMLAAGAFGPLYGKLSNMFGRRNATLNGAP